MILVLLFRVLQCTNYNSKVVVYARSTDTYLVVTTIPIRNVQKARSSDLPFVAILPHAKHFLYCMWHGRPSFCSLRAYMTFVSMTFIDRGTCCHAAFQLKVPYSFRSPFSSNSSFELYSSARIRSFERAQCFFSILTALQVTMVVPRSQALRNDALAKQTQIVPI